MLVYGKHNVQQIKKLMEFSPFLKTVYTDDKELFQKLLASSVLSQFIVSTETLIFMSVGSSDLFVASKGE